MIIGVPREIKNRERRVALTPEGADRLVASGHQVRIERQAGAGSGYDDDVYANAGASIVGTEEAWAVQLVVKVKEPLAEEFHFLRPGLCLFTFLHLAAVPELASELLRKKVLSIAYETVQTEDGALPLLMPMSKIAGRVAMQTGARLLQAENGTGFAGKGVLMGGVEGVPSAQVVIIGGGHAGSHAASVALAMGADVRILDSSISRVAQLQKMFGRRCESVLCAPVDIPVMLDDCDVLIGATLIPGEHAPCLLKAADLERMAGGVFVDIAIDQGGISETSRPTSYAEPVYIAAGVLHCCLPNLPAAVPRSATRALTHATLPYIRRLAGLGVREAIRDTSLAHGLNTWNGHVVHCAVAHALGLSFTALDDVRGACPLHDPL